MSTANYGQLPSCLKDILFLIKPNAEDRLKRENIISKLTCILKSERFEDVNIVPYGSYVSDLYTKWGGLEISLTMSSIPHTFTDNETQRMVLSLIHADLLKHSFGHNFQPVPLARVPILKFESNNIGCDVSIDDYAGCIKSKMLLWISRIDERFRDLVLLVKEWAKAHNIDDSQSGSLSSYALSLLVIFHLQTCIPLILPPLEAIYGGNVASDTDFGSIFNFPEWCIEEECAASIAEFRTENTASLSELLVSFFEKFSNIKSMAPHYVISTYTGKWENIEMKLRWRKKPSALVIEDPFHHKENASHSVSAEKLLNISSIFKSTYESLSSSALFSNKNELMHTLLKLEASILNDSNGLDEKPPNNTIVITIVTGNCRIHRILVASESEADIITKEALERMKIGSNKLQPFNGTILDHAGWPVNVIGKITLPVTVGETPMSSKVDVDFYVVKAKLVYNAILGKPGLNLLQAVVSTDDLLLKFPTLSGIGQVQGNRQAAKQCVANAPNFLPILRVINEGYLKSKKP